MAENHGPCCNDKRLTNRSQCGSRCQVIAIDTLPDDVLLVIFDFYADESQRTKKEIEAWQSLVHVCRRWRSLIFGYPRRLKLQLICTTKTPARDTLDTWPALPLRIRDWDPLPKGVDNIVAVLEHNDRVCQIDLRNVPSSHLEKVSAAMQVPFPELTHLWLESNDEVVPLLPDSFLAGSAPPLISLRLDRIPFPGLPKLLLSATHLVTLHQLHLLHIPHSGYFSPEAMGAALSKLTGLEVLYLEFQSPRSRPDLESRRPPPTTRSDLPGLTYFSFKGVSEYLDDLVARIDAPRLNTMSITFFNDMVFDAPQAIQFISRTPKLKALERAHVSFRIDAAEVHLSPQGFSYEGLYVKISCRELDWQVSSVGQVCTSCFPPLSTLEDLYTSLASDLQPDWQNNIENVLWLGLLRPFTAVKNLYLSKQVARLITPALKELVGGRTTEVLPALQNIFLEQFQPSGPDQEGVGQFVAARQVISRPIAVSRWVTTKR